MSEESHPSKRHKLIDTSTDTELDEEEEKGGDVFAANVDTLSGVDTASADIQH
jgi:hypothetical protein